MSTVDFPEVSKSNRVYIASHTHNTQLTKWTNFPKLPSCSCLCTVWFASLFSLLPAPHPCGHCPCGYPFFPDSTPTHLPILHDAERYNSPVNISSQQMLFKDGAHRFTERVLGRTYTRTVVWFHFYLKKLIKICLFNKYNTVFIRTIFSVLIQRVSAMAWLPHS